MKLIELLSAVEKLQDFSHTELQEAINILSEPVEDQLIRAYLSGKRMKEEYMQFDAIDEKYKRKSADEYEAIRVNALKQIEKEDGIEKQIEIIKSVSKEIKDAVLFLNYNEIHTSCVRITFMLEMARNMMLSGYSLMEINKCLPESSIADIYGVSQRLGINMNVTEEEKALIEKEKKEAEKGLSLSSIFEELHQKKIHGIPYHNSETKQWQIDNEKHVKYENALELAKEYAQVEITYPFFTDAPQPKVAECFSEVVEAALENPKTFRINGYEKYYSKQEQELLRTTVNKINEVYKKIDKNSTEYKGEKE